MDSLLHSLIHCHGTPGDEGEVAACLEACWAAAGWQVTRHGAYAVSARRAGSEFGRPVLLVCAHMDAPGYAVDRLPERPRRAARGVCLGLAALGRPDLAGAPAEALLKTAAGRFPGVVREGPEDDAGVRDAVFEFSGDAAVRAQTRPGDRVCFAPSLAQRGGRVAAPFLDNRLGCWLLGRLAQAAGAWRTPYDVVLGATAAEEFGGFGARVLAAQVRPDVAVVLDATYACGEQGVRLGGGPVLTLCDASVLLAPATRDRVSRLLDAAGVPLQTEVYNHSGTDARAFPQAGLACPVLPLLVPTHGNHTPRETADARDLQAWLEAVRAVAEGF